MGIEYEDFRDYEYGDDIRFIDWRLSARSTKPSGEMRLITKEFRAEKKVHTTIVFDYTASLAFKGKYLVSLYIAALLSEMSRQLSDNVTLVFLADNVKVLSNIDPAKIPYILLKYICLEEPRGSIGIKEVYDIYCSLGMKSPIYVITDYANPYQDYIAIARAARAANTFSTFYLVSTPEEISPRAAGRVTLVDPEIGVSLESELSTFYKHVRDHVATVKSALKLYSSMVEILGLRDALQKTYRILVSYQLARRQRG